jgi:hypothetical protein
MASSLVMNNVHIICIPVNIVQGKSRTMFTVRTDWHGCFGQGGNRPLRSGARPVGDVVCHFIAGLYCRPARGF